VVLSRFERLLMRLTRIELGDRAEFLGESSFRLLSSPLDGAVPIGLYELPRRSGEAHTYRLNHPLAEFLIDRARNRQLKPAMLQFSYDEHGGKVSVLEPLRGANGDLRLSLVTVESLDQTEDYLVFAAATAGGEVLDQDTASRLCSLPGDILEVTEPFTSPALDSVLEARKSAIQRSISERNARFFEAEADKLDGWADDLKLGLEREIKDLDRQIKEVRKASTSAQTLGKTGRSKANTLSRSSTQ
jgi:adenine-specific DNA-methyltransferase